MLGYSGAFLKHFIKCNLTSRSVYKYVSKAYAAKYHPAAPNKTHTIQRET